jgi:hypothetical protein
VLGEDIAGAVVGAPLQGAGLYLQSIQGRRANRLALATLKPHLRRSLNALFLIKQKNAAAS